MNNRQVNHLTMQLTTAAFCDKNSCGLSTFPAYSDYLTQLSQINTQISSISGLQLISLKGITNNKNQIRKNMITLGADSARKLTSYAKLTNNFTLAGEVNYTETDLRRCSDIQLRDCVQIIYNKAQEILPSLTNYGITEETQGVLLDNIASFIKVMPAPRLGITGRSQTTKQLAELFKVAAILLEKLDAMVEIIRLSEPSFYIGYRSSRRIIATGHSKLAVRGTVSDAQSGESIRGVVVSFVLNGHENELANATGSKAEVVKKTAAKGGFTVKSLAAGIYRVSFKKAGYVEQAVTAAVNDGELTVVNVALAKHEG